MARDSPTSELVFQAKRWFPVPVERVWERCTTKRGIESWWSPEDLRTTVRRLDLRPGGDVVLSLRYVPSLLGPERREAFRAAGVPISLEFRGHVTELVPHRRIVVELTLSLDRSGAGITSATEFDFEPFTGGTTTTLVAAGPHERHWETLGQSNLDGQLDRLERSLGLPPNRSPVAGPVG